MRIIDADAFKECWNEESVTGRTMRAVIDERPTVDPETLPVVQQLRAELEKVKAERDVAVNDLHKTILDCGACNACKHQFKECAGVNLCDFDGEDHWEWRGVKED